MREVRSFVGFFEEQYMKYVKMGNCCVENMQRKPLDLKLMQMIMELLNKTRYDTNRQFKVPRTIHILWSVLLFRP